MANSESSAPNQRRPGVDFAARLLSASCYGLIFSTIFRFGYGHGSLAISMVSGIIAAAFVFGGYELIVRELKPLLVFVASRLGWLAQVSDIERRQGWMESNFPLSMSAFAALVASFGLAFVGAVVYVSLVAGAELSIHASFLALKEILPVAMLWCNAIWAILTAKRLHEYGSQGRGSDLTALGLNLGRWKNALIGASLGGAVSATLVFVAPRLVAHHVVLNSDRSWTGNAWPGFMANSIVLVMIAPIVEEVIFRGVLFGELTRKYGVGMASTTSGSVFLALHIEGASHYWPALLALGLLTAITTYLRWSFKSVGPGIAAHACYNSVIVAAGFFTIW